MATETRCFDCPWELADPIHHDQKAFDYHQFRSIGGRISELEAGLRKVIAYLRQEPYTASYGYLSAALEVAERTLNESSVLEQDVAK